MPPRIHHEIHKYKSEYGRKLQVKGRWMQTRHPSAPGMPLPPTFSLCWGVLSSPFTGKLLLSSSVSACLSCCQGASLRFRRGRAPSLFQHRSLLLDPVPLGQGPAGRVHASPQSHGEVALAKSCGTHSPARPACRCPSLRTGWTCRGL